MSSNKTILMTMPEELKIASNGSWLSAEVLISHKGIIDYLNANLEFNKDKQQYQVRQNDRAVLIEIEDTAAIVSSVEFLANSYELILTNGSRIKTDALCLAACQSSQGKQHYYLKLDFLGRQVWARLLSAAVQAISPSIVLEKETYYFKDQKQKTKIIETKRELLEI